MFFTIMKTNFEKLRRAVRLTACALPVPFAWNPLLQESTQFMPSLLYSGSLRKYHLLRDAWPPSLKCPVPIPCTLLTHSLPFHLLHFINNV